MPYNVKAILIGGGGGGGNSQRKTYLGKYSGGGGAGGFLQNNSVSVDVGTYPIVVGTGGAAYVNGTNSTGLGLVSYGGGHGGGLGDYNTDGLEPGYAGGSGGGGAGGPYGPSNPSTTYYPGGTAVAGQGYAGGAGANIYYQYYTTFAGGGGGGAGGAGVTAGQAAGGSGGIGVQSDIDGVNKYYAAGGGGMGYTSAGTGGSGIGGTSNFNGGNSYIFNTLGAAGRKYTGSGGAGRGNTSDTVAGVGGQGVVFISFVSADLPYVYVTGTGNFLSTKGANTVATFINDGNFIISNTPKIQVQALVVAGGGAGGSTSYGYSRDAAGGGAGGVLYNENLEITYGTHTITVGNGGTSSGNGYTDGNDGQNSSIGTLAVAIGGGGGGHGDSDNGGAGHNGGSGGGAGNIGPRSGGVGIPSQGNSGASIFGDGIAGGGGGAGAEANSGNGGNGFTTSISGTSVTYGGGGGAASSNGGTGGGGDGSRNTYPTSVGAETGEANTGGGGGGGLAMGQYTGPNPCPGGAGGTGIVILRWLTSTHGTCSVTGTGNTIYADGSYTVAKFIVSGTFTLRGFTDPANIYSSDDTYTTVPSTDGVVQVQLSKDAGVNWTPAMPALSATFTGTDTVQTLGAGSTELWGDAWTRTSINDTNFRVKLTVGTAYQVYKTFGFTSGSDILTGIEIAIEGHYANPLLYLDHLKMKAYYGTSVLPVQPGSQAYASNGRKAGEIAGNGTGVLCFYDNAAHWCAVDTGLTVTA